MRELDVPGEIKDRKVFSFEFSNVEMQYESYNGVNVRLRYILKVTISRSYAANIIKEKDFWVRHLCHSSLSEWKSRWVNNRCACRCSVKMITSNCDAANIVQEKNLRVCTSALLYFPSLPPETLSSCGPFVDNESKTVLTFVRPSYTCPLSRCL